MSSAMTVEVRVPPLPTTGAKAVIREWHKENGSSVAAGEPLVTLGTANGPTVVIAEVSGLLPSRWPAKPLSKPDCATAACAGAATEDATSWLYVSSTNPTNGIKPGTNTEPTTGKKKHEESDFHPIHHNDLPITF